MVAEKKRGEELEPASRAALPWVCGKGRLRSQERAEWRGRSRGCVMMGGTTGPSMQTRQSSREHVDGGEGGETC